MEQILISFLCIESDEVVGDEERQNRISKMTPIEDLQAQDDHHYAPLCIKVQYFLKN